MQWKNILAAFVLVTAIVANTAAQSTGKRQTKEAAYSLIKRILPQRLHNRFEVRMIASEKDKDVFELYSSGRKIVLAGSDGVAIAGALNYYLKNYAHCDISWNGTNLNIPDPLPPVAEKVRKLTPYTYRYYLNYCTFNYTMSWWDWDRWEKEIDWMALNGINMPLALTGQNMIWYRLYKNLGFTDKELESFFSGPAYFNWFWMGNLDGWGGPLPLSWMKSHEELQKKILARQRELGMTPVLPAFTGHVPPAFKKRFPNALLKQTKWSGFPQVSILDPEDPMFIEIGKRFIEELTRTYGTDHFYSADTFNENKPPTNDSTYLSQMSNQVYQAMAAGDPQAKWIMQGWLFHFQSGFWKPTQIKALLNAVPDDRMIILDLWSENNPVWNKTGAYYGKPWIWCMLHNFGGNISMYGRMDEVAATPASLLGQPQAGQLSGIGLTPEAIGQNPVMYQLMLENVWRDKPIDLNSWIKDYACRRYGAENEDAANAWMILKNTVYNAGVSNGGPESIITGRPTFEAKAACTNTTKGYRPADLLPAWDLLLAASDKLKNSEGFRYDLVDLTRQVLANYADTLQRDFASAYKAGKKEQYQVLSNRFLQVIDDMETLLATQEDFLLGRWLNAAKQWGTTDAEKALYEKNARNLITLWGDKNSKLNEYACKQWSGMLKDFYKPRWAKFFTLASGKLESGQPFDQRAFETEIKEWEWQWVNSRKEYSSLPEGDPVETVQQLYRRYREQVDKPFYALPVMARSAPPARPNIIILFMDDMGYGDLECFGATGYRTPHINRLAAEGMRFTDFYVPQATCTASRAALLTGCYPNRISMPGVLAPNKGMGLHPREETIAELLKLVGYRTGMIGKWHLGNEPEFLPTRQGFDEYYGLPYSNDMWPVDYDGKPVGSSHPKGRYPPLALLQTTVDNPSVDTAMIIRDLNDQARLTTLYTDKATAFIRKNKNAPFFLYLAHSMTHVPLGVSSRFKGKSRQGMFGDVMMEIDWSVGELMHTLKELKLENNTLVIFASDNGPWLNYGNHAGSAAGFREGKGTSWEGGTRVPAIMKWPGVVPAGTVSNKLSSTIDILPTLAVITGSGLPARQIDGVNILPLMQDVTDAEPRTSFSYYYKKNDLEAVRSGNWKLVFPHKFRSYEDVMPGNDGHPGPYKAGVLQEKALYDLRRDPGERYDVKEKYPEIVKELEVLAEAARDDLGDNLTHREGKNKRPVGTIKK